MTLIQPRNNEILYRNPGYISKNLRDDFNLDGTGNDPARDIAALLALRAWLMATPGRKSVFAPKNGILNMGTYTGQIDLSADDVDWRGIEGLQIRNSADRETSLAPQLIFGNNCQFGEQRVYFERGATFQKCIQLRSQTSGCFVFDGDVPYGTKRLMPITATGTPNALDGTDTGELNLQPGEKFLLKVTVLGGTAPNTISGVTLRLHNGTYDETWPLKDSAGNPLVVPAWSGAVGQQYLTIMRPWDEDLEYLAVLSVGGVPNTSQIDFTGLLTLDPTGAPQMRDRRISGDDYYVPAYPEAEDTSTRVSMEMDIWLYANNCRYAWTVQGGSFNQYANPAALTLWTPSSNTFVMDGIRLRGGKITNFVRGMSEHLVSNYSCSEVDVRIRLPLPFGIGQGEPGLNCNLISDCENATFRDCVWMDASEHISRLSGVASSGLVPQCFGIHYFSMTGAGGGQTIFKVNAGVGEDFSQRQIPFLDVVFDDCHGYDAGLSHNPPIPNEATFLLYNIVGLKMTGCSAEPRLSGKCGYNGLTIGGSSGRVEGFLSVSPYNSGIGLVQKRVDPTRMSNLYLLDCRVENVGNLGVEGDVRDSGQQVVTTNVADAYTAAMPPGFVWEPATMIVARMSAINTTTTPSLNGIIIKDSRGNPLVAVATPPAIAQVPYWAGNDYVYLYNDPDQYTGNVLTGTQQLLLLAIPGIYPRIYGTPTQPQDPTILEDVVIQVGMATVGAEAIFVATQGGYNILATDAINDCSIDVTQFEDVTGIGGTVNGLPMRTRGPTGRIPKVTHGGSTILHAGEAVLDVSNDTAPMIFTLQDESVLLPGMVYGITDANGSAGTNNLILRKHDATVLTTINIPYGTAAWCWDGTQFIPAQL